MLGASIMLLRLLLSTRAVRRRRPLLDDLAGRAFVSVVRGGGPLFEAVGREVVDLVVLDLLDLGDDPWGRVAALRALPEAPEIVVLDRPGGSAEHAAALAAGCLAVLDSGLDSRSLAAALAGACVRMRTARKGVLPSRGERFDPRLEALGTRSEAIRRLHTEARAAAASDAPVLIQGEPGAGRTFLGPALHLESPRSAGPFRRLRCTGLGSEEFSGALFGHEAEALVGSARARRGLCEEAHGGTLFLENLDEAASDAQQTLARFLDDHMVRPLGGAKEIAVGVRVLMSVPAPNSERARPELLPELRARIGLQVLSLPPLRERREDLPELARSALRRVNRRHGLYLEDFEADAMEAIVQHSWPGNLSELWSVIERATLVARGTRIEREDLPADLTAYASGAESAPTNLRIEAEWLGDSARLPTLRELRERCLEVVERAYLAEVLRLSGGRVEDSARRADVDPRSLRARMRSLGLRKEDFKLPRRPPGAAPEA
jgi:DNA-binding NtrC family response regulator